MKLVVKKKKGCFPNINVCLESRDALVKLEINALTYRDDKEKELYYEVERVVFNYEVEKPN